VVGSVTNERHMPLSQRWRVAAWTGLVLLFIVRTGIGFLGLSAPVESLVSDCLTYLAPMILADIALAVVAHRTRGVAENLVWAPLALAIFLVALAESYWTWYAAMVRPNGPPAGLFNLLYLAALLLLVVSVIRITRTGGGFSADRFRWFLITVSLGAVVFSFVYLYWTYPAMVLKQGADNLVAIVMALYPVAGLLIALGASVVFVSRKARHWRPWEWLTVASFSVFAFGLMVQPLWYSKVLSASDSGPTWYTTILGVGFWLLGTGAVYRLSSVDTDGILEIWSASYREGRLDDGHYLLALSIAVPCVGWLSLAQSDAVSSGPLVIATALLAASFVGQSWVTAVVRSQLHRQIRDDRLDWPMAPDDFKAKLASCIKSASQPGSCLTLILMTSPTARFGDASVPPSRRIAQVIHDVCAEHEAYRLSDDQYAVLCKNRQPHEAAIFARRIWLQLVRQPSHSTVPLEIIAGIASTSQGLQDAEALFQAARVACAQSDTAQSEPVTVFDGTHSQPSNPSRAVAGSRAFRSTIRTLAQAVDGRHPNTRDHSVHVSELAVALAQVLDFPAERIQIIGLAALIHDIGKIGVGDEVLFKTTELTSDEQQLLEQHVMLGAQILGAAGVDDVIPAVRHHHERWDGTGYPQGLVEHEIPVEARILAVCDSFVTLTSPQPSQTAHDADQALLELQRLSGERLDPQLVAVFTRLIRGLKNPGADGPTRRRSSSPAHSTDTATGSSSAR